MAKTVIGVFDDFTAALNTAPDLVSDGFARETISVVAPDTKGEYEQYFNSPTDPHIETDTGIGAAIGGVGGLLVGLAALAIPGIGPVIAAGPLVAALAGATVGAATGSLVGALNGLGLPESEAEAYHTGIREGHSLVIVRADESVVGQAVEIMHRHRALRVDEHDPQSPPSRQT